VVIDFAPHPALPEDYEELVAYVRANNFETSVPQIQRNPETGGPRLVFSFDPADVTGSELRAQLYHQGQAVSEVWLYRWTV
jgi:glucans biosynthesis protein